MLSVAERIISGEVEPPPVAKLIGFNLRSVKPGPAVLDMRAGPQHWNPMGGLHGGILCDLTDAAMGIAYASTLVEGETFATVELKINFLRPVKDGLLIAEGWVVSGGARSGAPRWRSGTRTGALWRRRAARARRLGALSALSLRAFDKMICFHRRWATLTFNSRSRIQPIQPSLRLLKHSWIQVPQ